MATDPTRPTEGLECCECSAVTAVRGTAHDFDPCPACGEESTTAVRITTCPAMPGAPECRDDDHHFGLDAHVTAKS